MLLDDRVEQVAALRRQGVSGADIARRFGVSNATVYALCRKHGIDTRKSKKKNRDHLYVAWNAGVFIGKGFHRHVSDDEFSQIVTLTQQWGCKTMSEAVAEIVKDYLAERAQS